MNVRLQSSFKKHFCCIVAISISGTLFASKIDVPLFLLSGQSNMVGMQNSVNDLTTDQKKLVDNVKIYLDIGTPSLPEGDAAKKKKWSTLGPGFGNSASCLGPELFLGRTLSDSMPGIKFAFIKDAASGTYLGKSGEWLPPSSNNGNGGKLYKNMMAAIDTAISKFNIAFDTAQYTPRWAGFVWLQGEFDAMDQTLANKYEENLTNLIKDIRTKAGVPDLPVILPMIDVQNMWTYNSKIRDADVACKKKLINVDTMDTKGLQTNGIHYGAKGQVTIGTICAQRWLAMKFTKDWWIPVPVVYRTIPAAPSITMSYLPIDAALFDLSGRRIGVTASAYGFVHNPGMTSTRVMIRTTDNKSGKLQYSGQTLNMTR